MTEASGFLIGFGGGATVMWGMALAYFYADRWAQRQRRENSRAQRVKTVVTTAKPIAKPTSAAPIQFTCERDPADFSMFLQALPK